MNRAISTAQWYRVTVPAAESATRGKVLQNDFETLFTINGAPKGAALFSSQDDGQNHLFYFSPGAVAIARGLIEHFSGEPCVAPVAEAESPKLVVGRADERDLLLKKAESLK